MASSLVHERWLAGSQLGDATLFPEDRDRINRTWNVFKLVDENPKRGASRARFALYRNGMSVEEYIQAVVERGGEESRRAGRHLLGLKSQVYRCTRAGQSLDGRRGEGKAF